MIEASTLQSFVDRTVVLEFADGHVVRAKLLLVRADSPCEIMYDVVEIIKSGPNIGPWVKPGAVLSVDSSGLVRIDLAEQDGTD